jgi:hypothetical protein
VSQLNKLVSLKVPEDQTREIVSKMFNIFEDQIKMTYNGHELIKDYDNLGTNREIKRDKNHRHYSEYGW